MKGNFIFILALSFVMLLFCDSFAQNSLRKRIFDASRDAAYNYLMNANRPAPDFSSDIIEKNNIAVDFSGYTDGNYPGVSLTGTYGVTDCFNVIANMDLFTTNYNLSGTKFTGVGDLLVSLRYAPGEGKVFSHYIETSVKIPTAKSDDQLGTGKFDYYLGIIENYSKGNLSVDIAANIDLLGRPDFPAANKKLSAVVQQAIDSAKSLYDFKFQTGYSLSLYPTYSINDIWSVSTGIDFSRDMKFNFNSATFYMGLAYNFSDKISFSAGSDFNIINSSDYTLSGDLSISY